MAVAGTRREHLEFQIGILDLTIGYYKRNTSGRAYFACVFKGHGSIVNCPCCGSIVLVDVWGELFQSHYK